MTCDLMALLLVGLFLLWVNGMSYLNQPEPTQTPGHTTSPLTWPIPVFYSGLIFTVFASTMMKSEILAIGVLLVGGAITIYVSMRLVFGSTSQKAKKKNNDQGDQTAAFPTDDRPDNIV
jgi:hypothetical protein